MAKLWSILSPAFSKTFENYGGTAVGVLVSVGVTASTLPETLLLSRMRKMFAFVDEGEKDKTIESDLKAEIDKVLYKILLRPEDEANLDFFISSTSDPIHYGSLKMRSGAIIGLPASLEYKEGESWQGEMLTFQGIPLNVSGSKDDGASSSSLTDLRTSLLSTIPSKNFLIAREINYTNSHHIHFLVSVKALLGFSTFTTYYFFDSNLRAAGRRLRGGVTVAVIGIMSALASIFYLSIKDAYNCWLDYSVDKAACSLGKDYAKGGLDYYNNVLLRNKSLRHLSQTGATYFTPYGNETSTFRVKHMQLTARRDNLAKWLEEYEKGNGMEKEDAENIYYKKLNFKDLMKNGKD